MVALCIGPAIAAPAWARYLRISVATTKADLLDADDAVRNNIALPDPAQRQSRHRAAIQSMIAELETVVRFDSTHVLARIRLAAARLQWFELLQQQTELPMPLAAVRDAALQSHFNSRAELDTWLDRAIGPHCAQLELARQEIHQALALCPLYGEAYLYMSDLCFLEGANSAAKNCYLLQALAVRPYDGEIHFEVGKECFLQGRTQQAIDHWRIAYHNSQEFKLRLIELFTNELAAQVPIDFFLNNFQPDLDGLRQLRAHFRRSPPSDQRTALWQYSTTAITKAAASQQGSAACPLWLEAELLYRELAEAGNRLVCVKQALAADASDYSAHYTAVNCYYDQNDLNSAADQVKWCLARAPNDANLKRIRDAIVKARLNTTPDPETTSLKITGIQPSEIRAPEAQHAVDTSIKR
jgi:Tfp pilus assembly protein PilF